MMRCTAELGGGGGAGSEGWSRLQLLQGQGGRQGQVTVLQYNMVRCTAELGEGVGTGKTSTAAGAAGTPGTDHSPEIQHGEVYSRITL
jgi:hypothetical protein